MTNKRFTPRKGISLIELVVVTGILAALFAILYPVVGEVREKGNAVHCIGNLRTISIGLSGYLADVGHYPGANVDSPEGAKHWYHALEPYITGNQPDWTRALEPWMLCPTKNPTGTGLSAAGYGYNYIGFGSVSEASGSWDEPGNGYMRKYWNLLPAKIVDPGNVIVIGDNRDTGGIARYIYNSYTATSYASRHRGGGHYLYADNHIQWLGSQQIADLSRETNKRIFNPF